MGLYSLMFIQDEEQKAKDIEEANTMFKKYRKAELIDYIATKTSFGKRNCKEYGYNYFISTFKNNTKSDLILAAYTFYRRTFRRRYKT